MINWAPSLVARNCAGAMALMLAANAAAISSRVSTVNGVASFPSASTIATVCVTTVAVLPVRSVIDHTSPSAGVPPRVTVAPTAGGDVTFTAVVPSANWTS